MTPGISLTFWQRQGVLSRELQLYRRYREAGWRVTFLSVGGDSDRSVLPEGFEVEAFGARAWPRLHAVGLVSPGALLSAVHSFRRASVVKTNQAVAALPVCLAARLARRPILLRCGWLPGRCLADQGLGRTRLAWLRLLESLAFHLADAVQVATQADARFVTKHYHVAHHKIHVVPNWIDTERFAPELHTRISRSVITVGRLHAVKRLDLLMAACKRARVELLTLVGAGPQRAALEGLAAQLRLNVRFSGNVEQAELPALLNAHQVFALCSRVEGHPKALLEAMACGLPCVGTNVAGINEVILDGSSGVLADSTPESIAACLERLFGDDALREALGDRARRHVQAHCAFDAVFTAEHAILDKLSGHKG